MDIWGNVKLLDFRHVQAQHNQSARDGWYSVDHGHLVTYSSLVGIPVAGVPATGQVFFSLSNRYWTVTDCLSDYVPDSYDITTKFELSLKGNFSLEGRRSNAPAAPASFNFLSAPKRNFPVTSPFDVSSATCNLGILDIESQVSCRERLCRVDAMRASSDSRPILHNSNWPQNDKSQIDCSTRLITTGIESFRTLWTQSTEPTFATPLQQWLVDPLTTFSPSYVANISGLPADEFAKRFQQAFNAF